MEPTASAKTKIVVAHDIDGLRSDVEMEEHLL